MTSSEESGEVKCATVDSWKERILEIAGYSAKDIWNMDETSCYWRALPAKHLGQKGKSCKGGKKCKQRITVAFFEKKSNQLLFGHLKALNASRE